MPGNQRANTKITRKPSPPASRHAVTSTLLDARKLKALYAALVRCRMLEERLAARMRRRARAASAESAFGEEALLVGAAFDLLPGDCVAPSPRASIASFIQGAALPESISETGNDGESMPGCAVKLGIGAGLALAFKTQKKPHVALCLMGQTQLTHSAWEEALAFAGKHKLPVVFVVKTRSSAGKPPQPTPGNSVPAITVDGSDVVAVYRVMQEAIRRARQGYGPSLIEGRLHGKDPLEVMEHYLRQRGLWSDAWRDRLAADFRAKLKRATRTGK
jgi:2-oxoisovalerate dehydrogenase E1 component alpha subunit